MQCEVSQNGLYTTVDAKLCIVGGFILWAYDFLMNNYLILRCLFRRDGIIFFLSVFMHDSIVVTDTIIAINRIVIRFACMAIQIEVL